MPFASVPACSVAVSPVTPVEAIEVPALYAIALPPVYGTVPDAENKTLAVAVAEKEPPVHINDVIVAEVLPPPPLPDESDFEQDDDNNMHVMISEITIGLLECIAC